MRTESCRYNELFNFKKCKSGSGKSHKSGCYQFKNERGDCVKYFAIHINKKKSFLL